MIDSLIVKPLQQTFMPKMHKKYVWRPPLVELKCSPRTQTPDPLAAIKGPYF